MKMSDKLVDVLCEFSFDSLEEINISNQISLFKVITKSEKWESKSCLQKSGPYSIRYR